MQRGDLRGGGVNAPGGGRAGAGDAAGGVSINL